MIDKEETCTEILQLKWLHQEEKQISFVQFNVLDAASSRYFFKVVTRI